MIESGEVENKSSSKPLVLFKEFINEASSDIDICWSGTVLHGHLKHYQG